MPQEAAWTIKRLLEWTGAFFARKDVGASPRLSAEQLLAHVLHVPRIKLYTDFDRVLDEKDLACFRELVKRAAEQEPIAYLTGKAHFFNLEFEVTPDVLIPRPDTETLVENVLQLARRTSGFETPRVLDLCTGSGCIAAAIARHHPNSTIVAIELDPKALQIAQKNIEILGLSQRIALLQGDLYEPLASDVDRNPFDMIVANPPYIATANIASLDRSVRDYEPVQALDGGLDGLSFHRRILAGAPPRLRSGGRVFLEIAFDQGEAILALSKDCPELEDFRVLKDHAGNDRVLTGTRK
jgi:release factor glutamine methyltransferase